MPVLGPTPRADRRRPGGARPAVVAAVPCGMVGGGRARRALRRAVDAPIGRGHAGNVRPGTSGVGLPEREVAG